MSQEKTENNVNEIDIHQLWSEVVANKWKVIITTAVFFVLGILLAVVTQPKYQTNALIQMNRSDNSISSISSLASLVGNLTNQPTQATPAMIETTLLQSRYVLAPVVQKLGLDIIANPHHFPIIRHFLAKDLNAITVSHLTVPSTLLGERLSLVKGSQNTFSVYDPDGILLVKGKVGTLVTSKQYPDFSIKITQLQGKAGRTFDLEKMRMDDAITKLNQSFTIDTNNPTNMPYTDTGVLQLDFVSHHPMQAVTILNSIVDTAYQLGIEQQSMEAERVISFLDQQIPKVKQQLQTAEDALSKYQAKTGNVGAGVAGLSSQAQILLEEIVNVNQQLEQLKLKKTDLLQLYTPDHPYIITIDNKIKSVQREQEKLQKQVKHLPLSDKKAVQLLRDVKTKNQLYLMLLSKQQELQVLKAGVISNMKILDRAANPPRLLPSHRLLYVLVSIILGLLFSIAFIVIKMLFHHGVQDPEQIEEILGTSVNAIVPFSKQQQKISNSIKRSPVKKPRILAEDYPSDISIEAIRSLRTNMQIATLEGDKQIICISGLTPSIGKSFISLNLAYAYAQVQPDILLIDMDIRRGKIHQSFGIDPTPGLTDLLQNKASFDESVIRNYQGHKNLHFIPRGSLVKNPSELLQSDAISSFLYGLKDEYSTIIIDTPPILAVSDPLHIMKHADLNYLLLSAGKHSKREIMQAYNLLKVNQIQTDGVIFNFAEVTSSKKYYYYTGYSYKNYETYSDNKTHKDK